jgi:phosphoglucomutase
MATLPPIDESFENLGQIRPTANILTDAFTVDDNEQNIVSSCVIANLSSGKDYYTLTHALEGTADNSAQHFAENIIVNPNDSVAITIGKTLSGTDVMRVKSLNGNLTFNFWGVRLIPL